MCRFCWHEVKENLNGKCPACRQPYSEENYSFTPPNPEEIAQQLAKKKEKEKKKKKKEDKVSRKNLTNVRVIQKNLVYITNLALSAAKEEILRRPEYFGQYGKIQKVVVNKNNLYNINSPGGPSVSAYVTYFRPQDAMAAIKTVDGTWLGGRTLRASFGTTKYCTYFLKHIPCTNPDCMYLHELGDETSSFTKEEMATGKSSFHNKIHPALAEARGSNKAGLPPPPGLNMEDEASSLPPNGSNVVLGPPSKAPASVGLAPSSNGNTVVDPDGPNNKETNVEDESKDPSGAGQAKQAKPAWNKVPAAVAPPPVRINCSEWPTPNATPTPAPPPPPTKPKPSPNPNVLSRYEDRIPQSVLPPTASWASKANPVGNTSTSKLKQSAPVLLTKDAKEGAKVDDYAATTSASEEKERVKKQEKENRRITKQRESATKTEKDTPKGTEITGTSTESQPTIAAASVVADDSERTSTVETKEGVGTAASKKNAAAVQLHAESSSKEEQINSKEPSAEQKATKQEAKRAAREKEQRELQEKEQREKDTKEHHQKDDKKESKQGKGKKSKDSADGEDNASPATLSASGKKARSTSPRKNSKKDNKFVIIEPTYVSPTPTNEKDEADPKKKDTSKKANKQQRNANASATTAQAGIPTSSGLVSSGAALSIRNSIASGAASSSATSTASSAATSSTSPPPGFGGPPGLSSTSGFDASLRPASPPSVWDELVEEGDEELVRSVLPAGHHHHQTSYTSGSENLRSPNAVNKDNPCEANEWESVVSALTDDDKEPSTQHEDDMECDAWVELGLEDLITQSNIDFADEELDEEEVAENVINGADTFRLQRSSQGDAESSWRVTGSVKTERSSRSLASPPGFGLAWGAPSVDEIKANKTAASGTMERSRSRFGFAMEESEEEVHLSENSAIATLEHSVDDDDDNDDDGDVPARPSPTDTENGMHQGLSSSLCTKTPTSGLLATPLTNNMPMNDYMLRQQIASLKYDLHTNSLPLKDTPQYSGLWNGQSTTQTMLSQQQQQSQSHTHLHQETSDPIREAFRALFPPSVNISFAPAGPQSAPGAPVPSHVYRDQGAWSTASYGHKQTMSPIFNPTSPWGPPTLPSSQSKPNGKGGVWGSPPQPTHSNSSMAQDFPRQRKGQHSLQNSTTDLPLKEPSSAIKPPPSAAYATTAAQSKKAGLPQQQAQHKGEGGRKPAGQPMGPPQGMGSSHGSASAQLPGTFYQPERETRLVRSPMHADRGDVAGGSGPFHDPAIMGQGIALDMRVSENAWGGAYTRAFPMGGPPGMQIPGPHALAALPNRGMGNSVPPLIAPPGFNFASSAPPQQQQHQHALFQHQYQQATLFQNGGMEHHKRAAEQHMHHQQLHNHQQQAEQGRRSSAQSGRHTRPVKS